MPDCLRKLQAYKYRRTFSGLTDFPKTNTP